MSDCLQIARSAAIVAAFACLTAACSMTEEVRRIEQVKRIEKRRAAASSTDLTGEQVFIRSCNTCHPGGRQGTGPALDKVNEKFPDDAALARFIRKGKGAMPPQPKEALDDRELDNLVGYIRSLAGPERAAGKPRRQLQR